MYILILGWVVLWILFCLMALRHQQMESLERPFRIWEKEASRALEEQRRLFEIARKNNTDLNKYSNE